MSIISHLLLSSAPLSIESNATKSPDKGLLSWALVPQMLSNSSLILLTSTDFFGKSGGRPNSLDVRELGDGYCRDRRSLLTRFQ